MNRQKKIKSLVKVKALKTDDQKLIRNLIIAFFLCVACLVQTIAMADEEKPMKGEKPQLSEECKSLISQMRELRKQAREKKEEIIAAGGKPELEMDENGQPILPPELLAFKQQKEALKEQLKANNCPKPPGKKRGRKGKGRRGGMNDAPPQEESELFFSEE